MRNCIALGLCLALASVGICRGEEYLLTIQEVEEADAPELGPPAAFSPANGGWSEVGRAVWTQMNPVKSTEFLVSANSRFHLRIEEHGSVMELDGSLKKSDAAAAKQDGPAAKANGPTKKAAAEPGQDVIVDVEYKYASQDGPERIMKCTMPMRCGRKYRVPGGSAISSTTLWSLDEIKSKAAK